MLLPRLRFAALCVALAVGAAGCGADVMPPSAKSPLVQQPVPDFHRPSLAGPTVDTKSLRGHVVVVKFFAKYCEPCKRTLPAVEAIAHDHTDVAFVGVAEDEHSSDALEVVSTYGLTFPVVHDASNVLAGRYRVTEMPVTFVIDRQGVIRWVGGPDQTEGDLEQAIRAASR